MAPEKSGDRWMLSSMIVWTVSGVRVTQHDDPIPHRAGAPGERPRRLVALLHLETIEIQARARESRRRPGLEPAQRETEAGQLGAETDARPLPETTARHALLAAVEHATEERPGGQNRRRGADPAAHPPTGHRSRRHHRSADPIDLALDDGSGPEARRATAP